ncbi:hypothetical protein SNEBB_005733 [Seison nebaliae]|nr:hypothetical protein SNEBB_005733 [Seison nebaliae]
MVNELLVRNMDDLLLAFYSSVKMQNLITETEQFFIKNYIRKLLLSVAMTNEITNSYLMIMRKSIRTSIDGNGKKKKNERKSDLINDLIRDRNHLITDYFQIKLKNNCKNELPSESLSRSSRIRQRILSISNGIICLNETVGNLFDMIILGSIPQFPFLFNSSINDNNLERCNTERYLDPFHRKEIRQNFIRYFSFTQFHPRDIDDFRIDEIFQDRSHLHIFVEFINISVIMENYSKPNSSLMELSENQLLFIDIIWKTIRDQLLINDKFERIAWISIDMFHRILQIFELKYWKVGVGVEKEEENEMIDGNLLSFSMEDHEKFERLNRIFIRKSFSLNIQRVRLLLSSIKIMESLFNIDEIIFVFLILLFHPNFFFFFSTMRPIGDLYERLFINLDEFRLIHLNFSTESKRKKLTNSDLSFPIDQLERRVTIIAFYDQRLQAFQRLNMQKRFNKLFSRHLSNEQLTKIESHIIMNKELWLDYKKEFHEITIDCPALIDENIKEGLDMKRSSIFINENTGRVNSVELSALNYYLKYKEMQQGFHSENSFLNTLINIICFDVVHFQHINHIYSSVFTQILESEMSFTFTHPFSGNRNGSKYISINNSNILSKENIGESECGGERKEPFDIFAPQFYIRRAYIFEKFFHFLRTTTQSDLNKYYERIILDNYQNQDVHHSITMRNNQSHLINWSVFGNDCTEFLRIFLFILNSTPITDLIKLCKYTFSNYPMRRSGFPDLFLFNSKKIHFVEVKGPGDHLSAKQIIWLNKLVEFGFSAEVCYVKSY